ncbi:MAG: hypothetical protein IKW33_04905 [Clostridia bacterium]|nr:hypothetical protein [Clostridia bacterium]
MLDKKEDAPQKQTVVLTSAEKPEKKIVCDMCGYANPEYTSICKMCSNYLKGVRNV